MPTYAAIDIGSNGIRLAIGRTDADGSLQLLHSKREAIRLGEEAFSASNISEGTQQRLIAALRRFCDTTDSFGVRKTRIVGTSALREVHNRDAIIARVAEDTGMQIEVISGTEEARLIHLAIRSTVDFKGQTALLIDIGGGSVELTVATPEDILASDSYRMGAVRLLQVLKQNNIYRFTRLVTEYVKAAQRRIKKEIGDHPIGLLIGTGGNCEELGSLCHELLDRPDDSRVSSDDLTKLMEVMNSMTFRLRVMVLRMRPDRADVIIPAAIVLRSLMELSGLREIQTPGVGLKNGILLDLAAQEDNSEQQLHYREVIAAAHRLGVKFDIDEDHAAIVAGFAIRLFDDTASLHGLGDNYRMILEVAAMLHEIGKYVSPVGMHKHTQYLLENNPLLGLDPAKMQLLASLARYHRKSLPKEKHDSFRKLNKDQRHALQGLIPLLRLAIAMNEERAGRVHDYCSTLQNGPFTIQLKGDGDLELEYWAMEKLQPLFNQSLGVTLIIERQDAGNNPAANGQ